ncbi:MAG: serine--tRNA ligase [Patescibacteria group bacterium]
MDIKFIRQNPNLVEEGCRKKGVDVDIDEILKLDQEKREVIIKLENLRAEQNKISKKPSETEIIRMKEIKKEVQVLEESLKNLDEALNQLVMLVPNLPLPNVPEGKKEADNVVLRRVGQKPRFSFKPRDYLELNKKLDLIDVERAGKVSGSRFGYLKNEAVFLEFGLIQLAFEILTKKGFIPVVPPVMIGEKAMRAMGYLDRAADEVYYLPQDNLCLVGTSEQSIGPMHMDEILFEKDLPKRYLGFSTCFRREAGSYGKDVKGIMRVHQFDKVEMFVFCRPEDSEKEHQLLLKCEEELMQALKIPYRVVNNCAGQLAAPSAATYDIETWLPGQNCYRETHSTSNCTDFQAQRLNIRFRDKNNKIKFVHTLNGTAFAIGRTIIAILENYQKKDSTIIVPKVLQKYIKIKEIKPRFK